MPNKVGRPRVSKEGALAELFAVRLRPDQAREVKAAIRKSGKTKSDWLRDALLQAARGT